MTVFRARQAMGRTVRGPALVANDGFSARYDLDRITGVFSRSAHKLAGQSYVGKILVLDTAKGTPDEEENNRSQQERQRIAESISHNDRATTLGPWDVSGITVDLEHVSLGIGPFCAPL